MINSPIYLILIFFIFSCQLFSQNFSGNIRDNSGENLIGSTVYIKETNQGLVCNEKGLFQTNIKKGRYTIEYRSLGYIPITEVIEILDTPVIRDIILKEKVFDLKEVFINNKEDPAYAIIRNVIERAPYFLNAPKYYQANVYTKANMRLDDVSRLINRITSTNGLKISDLKNQMFIQESYSELQFTSPDKYKRTIMAFSSSLPDNFEPENSFGAITSSLYAPMYNGSVSPLNPKAFTYYKYRYEGFVEENGEIVNKIRFDAKYDDPILMSGYLYITDNIWDIQYAELTKDFLGIKQHYFITYQKIKNNIYLPVNYSFTSAINTFGVKGYFNYFSSIQYKEIDINDDVAEIVSQTKKKKKNLEIRPDSLNIIIKDTLATKRDSAYWSSVRTLPLKNDEIISLNSKNLIQERINDIRKKRISGSIKISDLILGGQIGNDTSKISFRYDGLLLAIPEYNFVDGAWIGQKVYIKKRFKKHHTLNIAPYLYYTWGRNKFIYGSSFNLKYAPMNRGDLNLSLGSISRDFNPDGITRFDNFISSAMYRKSDNYFYLKDFILVKNVIELTNALSLNTEFEIAKRSGSKNHANWGIWGSISKIKPNILSDDRFDATSYSIALSYAPRTYYTIYKGLKKNIRTTSPIFTLRYNEGFSSWQTNNSKYRILSGEITQKIELGYFSNLDYMVAGGSFLGNTSDTHFADYHHFNASKMFSISKWPQNTFVLLNNYEASTNRYWIQGHINYQNRYLLIKRIPFLQKYPIVENIHLKMLYTPDFKTYSEIGYSIGMLRLFNFGIHASFHEGEYNEFGFRLSYILRDIIKAL